MKFKKTKQNWLWFDVDSVDIFSDSNTCRPFFHTVPCYHDSIISAKFRRWANKGVTHLGTDNTQIFAEMAVAGYASGYDLGNFEFLNYAVTCNHTGYKGCGFYTNFLAPSGIICFMSTYNIPRCSLLQMWPNRACWKLAHKLAADGSTWSASMSAKNFHKFHLAFFSHEKIMPTVVFFFALYMSVDFCS